MHLPTQTIHIHPAAPPKPPEGQPCNGCGVCCLSEPCPLGMVLSRKRHGACDVLRWSDTQQQYRCAALMEPDTLVRRALPAALRWLVRPLAFLLRRLARRWIAAGVGCDSNLEPGRKDSTTMPATLQP